MLDAIEEAGRRPRLSPHALLREDAAGSEGGALLVVLPERAVRISESGREILTLCDGARTAAGVAAALRDRHEGVSQIEPDVHVFLAQMERLGVVVSER